MPLNLDIGVGDEITIGDVKIAMLHKTGRKARLSIEATDDIDVSLLKAPPKPASPGFGSGKKEVSA